MKFTIRKADRGMGHAVFAVFKDKEMYVECGADYDKAVAIKNGMSAMKALEGLTPGGSEYVNDVENCVAAIKSARELEHNGMLMWAARARKLMDAKSKVWILVHQEQDVDDSDSDTYSIIGACSTLEDARATALKHKPLNGSNPFESVPSDKGEGWEFQSKHEDIFETIRIEEWEIK